MKRLIVLLALVALLLPGLSYAGPDGVKTLTATGGFRLALVNSSGPELLEVQSDGNATLIIVSSVDGSGANPNTSRRNWPDGVYGDSSIPLRAGVARLFETKGDKVDSVYVVFNGASWVDLTWQND